MPSLEFFGCSWSDVFGEKLRNIWNLVPRAPFQREVNKLSNLLSEQTKTIQVWSVKTNDPMAFEIVSLLFWGLDRKKIFMKTRYDFRIMTNKLRAWQMIPTKLKFPESKLGWILFMAFWLLILITCPTIVCISWCLAEGWQDGKVEGSIQKY